MAHLIPKDVVVAEIESKIEKYTKRGEESDAKRDGYGMYWGGVLSCLNEVRTLCDTLEVKEVDFKPIDDDFERDAVQFCLDNGLNTTPRIARTIAKHFFELGLRASLTEEKYKGNVKGSYTTTTEFKT